MKCRALFVDDEPLVLTGLNRTLRGLRSEWEFVFANSGQEALELLSNQRFDAVVSDMRMPNMDGAELLQTIAAKWPGVARFVLSGHAEIGAVLRSIRPAHRYFGKPCDPAVLIEALRSVSVVRQDTALDALCQKLGAHRRLPSPKESLTELRNELAGAGDLERLSSIIAGDIAMTAQILRVTNSAFFGSPIVTTEIQEALRSMRADVLDGLVNDIKLFRETDSNNRQAVEEINIQARLEVSRHPDATLRSQIMLKKYWPTRLNRS